MEHKCSLKTLKQENIESNEFKWFQKYTVISVDNPRRLSYFRSETSVKEEQIRQMSISCWVIHPFSKFRAWYDVYLIYLYGSVLFTKPFDAGFIKVDNCSNLSFYVFYNIITDCLCWIDIILNFITGYEKTSKRRIELRKKYIARYYMCSPYFICDVLSSTPKCLIYAIATTYLTRTWRRRLSGISSFLGLFKAPRIISFMRCIWKTAGYFQFSSRGLLFLTRTIIASLMILHWLACMQLAVPRFVRISLPSQVEKTSWFYSKSLYNGTLYTTQSVFVRYNHCLLKCSAYLLCIRMLFYEIEMPEEYLLAILTYFIGKVLIAFIWITLAMAIINGRIMELKFAEVMSQLQEYMKQKQVPLNLRSRILQHFNFKYRNRYFKEELIVSSLSENLKNEVNMHMCKLLVQNVSLFHQLSLIETSKVVQYLIPEIFLPNDTIIHAGTQGDAMYFLSTGTVGVYTRSGKEICHLQDGAYFGEISLVLKRQLRSATVTALETSQVFRLYKKDLEKYLLSNKEVRSKILNTAEERLKEAVNVEEQFKQILVNQSIRDLSFAHEGNVE